MKIVKKNIKTWQVLVTLFVFFILTASNFVYSLTEPYCVDGKQICDNGGIPQCSVSLYGEVGSPKCGSLDGTSYSQCCYFTSNGLQCPLTDMRPFCTEPSLPPTTPIAPSQPTTPTTPTQPTTPTIPTSPVQPTYGCLSGFATCPPSLTPIDPGGLCCLYGCCPSNKNLCKCPSSNQCSPNCSIQPTTPTQPAKPIGPTNCTSNAQCGIGKYCDFNFIQGGEHVGYCSENPKGCVVGCSNDNQCFGGSVCVSNCCQNKPSTPSTTSQPTTSQHNESIEIAGIDSIVITNTKFRRVTTKLIVNSFNFLQVRSCDVFYSSELDIRVQPKNFFLSEGNDSQVVRVTIPMSNKLKNARSIIFQINCDESTVIADKIISVIKRGNN